MLGTIVNSVAIIIGALLGNLIGNRFSENIKSTVLQGIALTVMVIGISMAISTENMLIITLSIVTGGIIGELLRIENHLDSLGQRLEARYAKDDSDFTQAFVSASLLYCVGAMAVMGAIESGLTGNHSILFVKSILDGVTAIIFSSSLGIGVAFSALPVFLYQGIITLAASSVKNLLSDGIIREMSATGGVLILGLGLNMLEIKMNIKVGNLLPAIFTAILFTILFSSITI